MALTVVEYCGMGTGKLNYHPLHASAK